MIGVFGEPVLPGSILFRGGPGALHYGCRYNSTLVAEPGFLSTDAMHWRYDPHGTDVILKGFVHKDGGPSPSLWRALMWRLGPRGFKLIVFERLDDDADRPYHTLPIGERYMSIEGAHDHEQKVFKAVLAEAQSDGLTGLADLLEVLQQKCEDGMPAALGADLRAQAKAVYDIHMAGADVIDAAIAVGKHKIHTGVANLINAIENVEQAVRAADKARMHMAVQQLTA